MAYYGRFYRSEMAPLLLRVNSYLRCWAGKKYRRRRPISGSRRVGGLVNRQPALRSMRWVRGVGLLMVRGAQ